MVNLHNPPMFVLLETKMTEHNSFTTALRFDTQIGGSSRDIMLMWKDNLLTFDNFFVTY